MNIFHFVTLCGGLAFFLYGMNVMSNALEQLSGGRLEGVLKRATSSRLKSLLLGAGITIAIQSSSAMTVMLVGLVNSGIMQLSQTVGVIMGSNIGTTLTAWILTSAGIESENLFISLLKPEFFSPILALVGIGMIMLAKRPKQKNIGTILVGFAVLMYGMDMMKNAVSPLADSPQFAGMLTAFRNPLIGVLTGAVFTGIIQSSAASVGILQALSLTGSISYTMAIPIIMGQNIGTCVTALISSIGVNRNAKRVSIVHITFNLIGTFLCLILFYGADAIFHFPFTDQAINPVMIAACHSIFNIFTTLFLLPASDFLVRIAQIVVPDRASGEKYAFLDERLLNTPSVAITECNRRTVKMADIAKQSICSSLDMLWKYSEEAENKVNLAEDELDFYEDKLGSFLVKVSSKSLSESDSRRVSRMLHAIGDFERIGDHALNISKTSKEICQKQVRFSEKAQHDLQIATEALREIINITFEAFRTEDLNLAQNVEPLEQVIDELTAEIKAGHIERLQNGNCTIEMGFVLSDILTNIERVSDHCSNIAAAMIELSQNSLDTHQYLNSVKRMENTQFKNKYSMYEKKYSL